MIKTIFNSIKKYNSFGVNNKKLLFHLVFSALLRSTSILLIPFMASKIVEALTIKDFPNAIIYSILFLLSSVIHVSFYHYNYRAYCKSSIYIHTKLQDVALEKVSKYDENFTKKISKSFIMSTAYNDIGNLHQFSDQIIDIVTNFISLVLELYILFSVNILVGTITIVLTIISIIYVVKNLTLKNYFLEEQKRYQDEISALMGQVLDGNKEIKSFDMKEDIYTYLNNFKKLRRKNYFKKRKYEDNVFVISPAILTIGKIILYLSSIYLILNNRFDIAMLVLIVGYYEDVEDNFYKFYSTLEKIYTNSIRIDRLYKIINYRTKNMLTFGDNNTDDIKGKIEFKKVSFTYEKQQIMKNISFTIEPNTFTAIVGKSGSGKSTIFRLLLRLYKTNNGTILLDEEDIYNYSKDVYSNNVAIVTQRPFVFDMTIRENLSLVDSNKDNQIEACKKVGIHDYIMSLEKGYNTKLISDGENLSIGQKQLLALARTLLSGAEVLLFDEVTSSLDINTSKKIISIIKKLKKDHTILMITHKPELMKMADDIIVIDRGKIVGRGTHKKLINDNKYYQILHK